MLVVAACRESYLLDYTNERSRFMFNFGDGAVAGLLVGDAGRNEVLGAHAITDGVVLAAGEGAGRRLGRSGRLPVPRRRRPGVDEGRSRPGVAAELRRARPAGAVERSGLTLDEIAFVCPLHTKRSMFLALLSELGMREDQAVYLDDTGHMSGVDSLLGLDRAVRDGRVGDGDAVLLLSAGTGYTWAATVVRWGRDQMKAGDTFGPSSWIEIPQEKIDAFAEATGDHQWIHVDPERAKDGPFGTTIGARLPDALAAAGRLVRGDPAPGRMGINYGLNRVRFPAPVPVGSRVRASLRGRSRSTSSRAAAQVTMTATVEREGGDKPVCVAEVVFRYYDVTGRARHRRARRHRRRDRRAARGGRLDRARRRRRRRRPDDPRRQPRRRRRRARRARSPRRDRPERRLPARRAGARLPGGARGTALLALLLTSPFLLAQVRVGGACRLRRRAGLRDRLGARAHRVAVQGGLRRGEARRARAREDARARRGGRRDHARPPSARRSCARRSPSAQVEERGLDAVIERHAVKRLLEPAEVADLVAFLLGPPGRGITGVPVPIDLGWTAA